MNENETRVALTESQLNNVYNYSGDIIENLSPKALDQLLGGYENDVDSLLNTLFEETNNVINFNASSISSDSFQGLESLETCMHERLKILSYNYFKATTLPEFRQNWRNLEWGNMAQMYSHLALLASRSSGKSHEFSFAYPLWRLFRYERPSLASLDTEDNKISKEGVIVSNSLGLGKKLLSKIVEEINVNDVLREKIVGGEKSRAILNTEKIVTQHGAIIELRSFDKTIRGLHPGWIVVDDFLDKSAIYSTEQRAKFKEVFFAEIMPALEPGGSITTVGTPFHPSDLYEDLRADTRFKLFEYPAVFPDGRLLAPDRYDILKLNAERKTLGSTVFAREYLITPISNSSSIFPWEFLQKAFIGMERIPYVDNIKSYPIKLKRVITACDLAISVQTGADFCAFITMGIDHFDNIYLINVWHKTGASANEQINQIVSINDRFRPNEIIVENNGFQKVIAQLSRDRGLRNITEFTQTELKKDLIQGFPALSAAFERGEIKMPYKEGKSKDMTSTICGELNVIAYDDDKCKLEAQHGHDDLAHALYIGFHRLRINKTTVKMHST